MQSTSEEITHVDAVVGQAGVLGHALAEVELHAVALRGVPQPAVHVPVRFDGDEGAPGGEVAEVGARLPGRSRRPPGQPGEHALLARAQVPLDVRVHQAEERGVEAAAHGVLLEPGLRAG